MSSRGNWATRNLPTFTAGWARVRAAAQGLRYGVRYGAQYEGAQTNRLVMDWVLAPIASADQELRGGLVTLRARARELGRNDSHGSRALSLLEENVVGPYGVTLQARVDTGDQERDRKINRAIENAWWEWGKPENCSADGKLSMVDIEKLVMRSRMQDGEVLIRILDGFADSPFGFALQVLDPDQLDHTLDRAARDGENEIRMGVEVNEWGRPVAYHLFKSHPYDYIGRRGTNERVRLDARDVIHLFKIRRPGQTRGVSELAPVMLDLRHLHSYREAELVAARMGAAKGGFFTPPADQIPDPNSVRGSKQRVQMTAEPGLYEEIPAGYTFTEIDPKHPNTAFGDFVKGVLKSIAAGLRLAYAGLTGDLTEVSFSSIRKGDLAEKDVYRDEQAWLTCYLLERIYPRWMRWAMTSGQLQLPSFRVTDWIAHEWMPRGWEWVDPLKDLLAGELAIALGLDSRTNIAAQRGRDFTDVIADLALEQQIATEAGIEISNFKGSQGGGSSSDNAFTTANAPSARARRAVAQDAAEEDPDLAVLMQAEEIIRKRGGFVKRNGNGHHHAEGGR